MFIKKKIITYIICILTIVFLSFCYFLNISYSANTGEVYLSNNKQILEKGEEVDIIVSIKNVRTASFTCYLYFDNSKLEYVTGPENTNVVENKIVYVWYDSTGGNNQKEGELCKFKFKAKDEGIADFNIEGEFYNSTGELIKNDFKQTQIQIGKKQTKLEKEAEEQYESDSQSNNASLQVLRLDREGITPIFEKDIKEYYITIPSSVNDIEVLAISENSNASIEVTGNTNLKQGLNIITIQVTSQDKTKNNIYTIKATKTDNVELANTNLEILAIENILLNPHFDANVTHYNIEVPNEITNLNIFAVPENENAKVEIIRKEELTEGNNLIKIIVTAQNGISQKVYQINAYKRNQEEENKYMEEQEANREKLEEIYETEKINDETKNMSEEKQDKKQSKIIFIIIIGIVVILLIFLIVWKYKK